MDAADGKLQGDNTRAKREELRLAYDYVCEHRNAQEPVSQRIKHFSQMGMLIKDPRGHAIQKVACPRKDDEKRDKRFCISRKKAESVDAKQREAERGNKVGDREDARPDIFRTGLSEQPTENLSGRVGYGKERFHKISLW